MRMHQKFFLAAITLGLGAASCTLITEVDRSQIPDDSAGGAGGESTGTGGEGTGGGASGGQGGAGGAGGAA